MGEFEDKQIFDFYIDSRINELKREGWSNKKIARWMRSKASEIDQHQKVKKVIVYGKSLIEVLKK